MEAYINHIEKSLSNEKEIPLLYEFKKQILSEMSNRANEITHTGLSDQSVLSDLIISEYADIKDRYKDFVVKSTAKKRAKRAVLTNVLGSIVYIISAVTIFLTYSLLTKAWAQSWLIIEGAMSLWVAFEIGLVIKKSTKARKIFHPGARILLAADVMIITQFVFLLSLVVFQVPKSWLIFILGIIMIFVCDAIYAGVTKQRLAILNYLFYIIAVSPMVYIIIGALNIVPWNKGWAIIPFALLLDMIIVAIKLIVRQRNVSYEEVE